MVLKNDAGDGGVGSGGGSTGPALLLPLLLMPLLELESGRSSVSSVAEGLDDADDAIARKK